MPVQDSEPGGKKEEEGGRERGRKRGTPSNIEPNPSLIQQIQVSEKNKPPLSGARKKKERRKRIRVAVYFHQSSAKNSTLRPGGKGRNRGSGCNLHAAAIKKKKKKDRSDRYFNPFQRKTILVE